MNAGGHSQPHAVAGLHANFKQGAVTEIVRSLPTKTLTFSGDALEDVPVCTCKQRDGPLCHPRLAKGPCAKISVSGRFSRFPFGLQSVHVQWWCCGVKLMCCR